MSRQRVLSGMRPTGKLHLGNYFGALKNWEEMQRTYDCFFFVADWHALTTDYGDTAQIRETGWPPASTPPARRCLSSPESPTTRCCTCCSR
jgi:hypothetical protein